MPHKFRRKKLSYLIHTALVSSLVVPVMAQAQDDDDIEEVVVTGSYLRNSAFAQDTAVDTVTSRGLVRVRRTEHGPVYSGPYLRTERRRCRRGTRWLRMAPKRLTAPASTCGDWVKTLP